MIQDAFPIMIEGPNILRVKDVLWKDELGLAHAMWILEVENVGPVIVESNARGESLFEGANKEINEKFLQLYQGLPEPAMKRLSEGTSPHEEVV